MSRTGPGRRIGRRRGHAASSRRGTWALSLAYAALLLVPGTLLLASGVRGSSDSTDGAPAGFATPEGLLQGPGAAPLGGGGGVPAGNARIGPAQAQWVDLGQVATYPLTVSNRAPTPMGVDLEWTPPPAGWAVAAFAADGVTPLPDTTGDGRPDVSLGANAGVTIVIAVTPPAAPAPENGINTTVTAEPTDGSGAEVTTLETNLAPYVAVDRWADPTTINLLGTGGVEETTITLALEGRGTALPGVGSQAADVVFVIDDTGSMGSWIDAAKRDVDRITDSLIENVTDVRFGLVSYKDVPFIDVDSPITANVAAFKAALNSLLASGGDDWPEDPDIALQTAANLTWRATGATKIMVLVGDAEAHNNNHLVGVAFWALQARDIHTNAVACGGDPSTIAWFLSTATNGGGYFANLGSPDALADEIIKGILAVVPPNDQAARDPDPTDFDPMIRDVLPPYIAHVPGTFVDPSTGAPKAPTSITTDAQGDTILGWDLARLRVNETWAVSFRVTSDRGGLVPTSVYGLSRVSFLSWRNDSRLLFLPETPVRVLAPPPITALSIGTPSVGAPLTYITSATPLGLTPQDRSRSGILHAWYRTDAGPWFDFLSSGPFAISDEGEHVVSWYSEDNAGNAEAAQGRTLRVDNSPPSTTLEVGSPKYVGVTLFVTPTTPFSLRAADGGPFPVGLGLVEFRIDGGAWAPNSLPFTIPIEGLHRVEYRSADLLGNTEATHAQTLIVDATPPGLTATVGAPSVVAGPRTWIRSNTSIALAAADPGTYASGLEGFEVRAWFGGWSPWSPYASPFTLTGDGLHYLEARAWDHLGLLVSLNVSLIVDDVPPATAPGVGNPNVLDGGLYVTSSTPLALAATDGGALPVGVARTEYRIDGGAWGAYAGPFALVGEGAHLVEYASSDLLGNAEAVRSLVAIVDDTPPELATAVGLPSHTSVGTWVTSGTPITLRALDPGTAAVGLGTFEYRVWFAGWTPWIPYASPFLLTGEGLHHLEMRARDRLGHASTSNETLIVDDTPPVPTVRLAGPTSGTAPLFVSSATTISIAATDEGPIPVGLRTLDHRPRGGPWSAYGAPFALRGPDGPRSVDYRAVDFLDHAGSGALDVVLDNSPPTTTIAVDEGPYTVASNFSLAAEDAGSGVSETRYRVDWGFWRPYDGPFHLPEGLHAVSFRSVDRLVNVEPEQVAWFRIGEPDARVTQNWKPAVAFLFSVALALVGVWSARTARWRGGGVAGAAKAFGATAVPFVLLEAATGALSRLTGLLAIPPLIGWGTVVDVGILAAGITVAVVRVWRARHPPPKSVAGGNPPVAAKPATRAGAKAGLAPPRSLPPPPKD